MYLYSQYQSEEWKRKRRNWLILAISMFFLGSVLTKIFELVK